MDGNSDPHGNRSNGRKNSGSSQRKESGKSNSPSKEGAPDLVRKTSQRKESPHNNTNTSVNTSLPAVVPPPVRKSSQTSGRKESVGRNSLERNASEPAATIPSCEPVPPACPAPQSIELNLPLTNIPPKPINSRSTSGTNGESKSEITITEEVKIPVPKVIVCRMFGVTSSESVGAHLYEYFRAKVPFFLDKHWDETDVQEVLGKIRENIQESGVSEFPVIPPATEPKEKIIEAVVKFVDVMSDANLDPAKMRHVNPSFIRLRSVILIAGMQEKDITNSHVYDDIPPAFKVWKEAGIRIATMSSTTRSAQKVYMTYTNHGDLCQYVSDTISLMHPSISTGDPANPDFRNMCKKVLEVDPTTVLLLTSKRSEARAARKTNMEVLLITREGMIGKKPLTSIKKETVKDLKIVKSMQSIVLLK